MEVGTKAVCVMDRGTGLDSTFVQLINQLIKVCGKRVKNTVKGLFCLEMGLSIKDPLNRGLEKAMEE